MAKESADHGKDHLEELVSSAWQEQNEKDDSILDKKRTRNVINRMIYDLDSSQELSDEAFD